MDATSTHPVPLFSVSPLRDLIPPRIRIPLTPQITNMRRVLRQHYAGASLSLATCYAVINDLRNPILGIEPIRV